MIGQIEPLEIGTEIIAYYDGDDKTISKYKITENISQGGSGIVYRAIRRRGINEKEVILKEYYPSSNRNSMFIRHDGVIVKSTEPDIPYCSVLLKKAKLEKANSEGCSGGSSDHPGVVSSDICLINDILCAKGVDPGDIVAVLFSPKTFNRKKTGVLFTKQGICGSDFLTKRLIRYDELKIVGLANNGKVAFLFKNGQYDEFDFPAAKMLVKLLNGDKKIRDYK